MTHQFSCTTCQFQYRVLQPHTGRMCRCVARKKRAAQRNAGSAKSTPKAMTPSTAYPYYDAKPMQFRGVKVRAEPPVINATLHSYKECKHPKVLASLSCSEGNMHQRCMEATAPQYIVNTFHAFRGDINYFVSHAAWQPVPCSLLTACLPAAGSSGRRRQQQPAQHPASQAQRQACLFCGRPCCGIALQFALPCCSWLDTLQPLKASRNLNRHLKLQIDC